jgi:hypothetical protein
MTTRERTHGKQSRVSRDPIPLFFLSINKRRRVPTYEASLLPAAKVILLELGSEPLSKVTTDVEELRLQTFNEEAFTELIISINGTPFGEVKKCRQRMLSEW